tara:strand:- start:328 stop:498 length:171 start_codon:yes stop_codon:yes gene_type:complete
MQIGDIAYDKSIEEIVVIVGITEDPRNPDAPVYTVITLDQSLDWEYNATIEVLEAL